MPRPNTKIPPTRFLLVAIMAMPITIRRVFQEIIYSFIGDPIISKLLSNSNPPSKTITVPSMMFLLFLFSILLDVNRFRKQK